VHCVASEPAYTVLRVSVVERGQEVAFETCVLGALRRGYRCLEMRSKLGATIERTLALALALALTLALTRTLSLRLPLPLTCLLGTKIELCSLLVHVEFASDHVGLP